MTKQIQLIPKVEGIPMYFQEEIDKELEAFEDAGIANDTLKYRAIFRLCKQTHVHHRLTVMNVLKHLQGIFDEEKLGINIDDILVEYEIKQQVLERFLDKIHLETKYPEIYDGVDPNVKLADVPYPPDELPF